VRDRVDGNVADLDLVGRGSEQSGDFLIDALDFE
jgi:hypothetical protein